MATTPFATYFGNRTAATTPLGSTDALMVLQGGVVKSVAMSNFMGTGSGLDADKLNGGHWVNVLNSSVSIANNTLSIVIIPATINGFRFYRYAVYSDPSVPIYQTYMSGVTCAYIVNYGAAVTNDLLQIYNAYGSTKTFYYKVDVWG